MRKTCFGKCMTRIMALILCGSMVVSSSLPSMAAKKTKNKDDKIETVYVNATAEGDPEKITVSEQLKNKGSDSLEDFTNLKDMRKRVTILRSRPRVKSSTCSPARSPLTR